MKFSKGVAIATTLAAVSLSLAACGSSSDSSGGTDDIKSSAAAQPTGTPIKVGFVVAETGVQVTQTAPMPAVAKVWQTWANDNGGIDGHPVEVITVDTKSDPVAYQSTVKDLVENQGVVALISADDAAEASAGDYLEKNDVPVIGGIGTDLTTWGVRPNYFQLQTSIPFTLLNQAGVAKAADTKNFGAIVCAEVAACLQAQGLFKPAAEGLGLKWTGISTAAAAAPNYTAQCLSLMQADTDFISLAVTADTAKRLVPDCLQQGFKGTFGINAQAFVQSVDETLTGAKFAGNLQAFPWWVDAAPVKEFRDAMKAYSPDTDFRTGNATIIWSTLELFRKTITGKTENVTKKTVLDAYDQIKDETLDGLLAQPMTFTAGKPQPKVACAWFYTYKPGDVNPTLVQEGASGNGAAGNLATSCSAM